jgi:hypothetical protein
MKTRKISLSKIAKTALLFGTSLAIFFTAPAAHSTPRRPLPSFVRVLSYNEVMRLPKAKRQAYIRGLRAMLKEIDRLPKKLRAAGDMPARTSQIATLLSLFAGDEAFAEESVPEHEAGVPYIGPKGSVTCGPGYNARVPVPRIAGVNGQSIDPASYMCMVGGRQTKRCGSGLIPVRQDQDGSFECATLKSFNRAPDALKVRARQVRHFDSLFDHSTKTFSTGYPSSESLSKRARAARAAQATAPAAAGAVAATTVPAAVAEARREAEQARARGASAPAHPPGVSAPATGVPGGRARSAEVGTGTTAPSAPSSGAASGAGPRETTSYEAVDNDGSGAILVTPVVPHDHLADSGGPEVSDETEGEGTTQASAEFGACEPQAENVCDGSSVEQARRQYASDPDPDCIYAGGISTYQDGRKRAYKCIAPSQFCFGSTTCTNSTGERMSADYSCEQGQVICNPLIFGVHSDGETPFCIEKSAQATATCDDESRADEGAVTPLDQEHAGLKEAWNDFSDRLFKMCHQNKIAAALHCAECDIITKRLFALNIAARDVKSCGAAIKFEDSQCDADGKCHGLPGRRDDRGSEGGSSRSGGARSVSDIRGVGEEELAEGDFASETTVVGTKRFEIRGDRGISSIGAPTPALKSKVHSMSDVAPKSVDSVFNTPYSRPK